MRIITTSAKWLFVVCLPILLVSISIWWAASSHWLYTAGFEKYDVAASTDLNLAELDQIAREMIAYFNSSDEFVESTVTRDGQSIDLFTKEEKFHFRDVKQLFRMDFGILLATTAYTLGYAAWNLHNRRLRQLTGTVFTGSVATLATLGLLGIVALIDFNWLWLQFHFLAFSNDFWSARGYMLLIFPSGFWYDAVTYCITATIGVTLGLMTATGVYLWLTRSATKERREWTQDARDS